MSDGDVNVGACIEVSAGIGWSLAYWREYFSNILQKLPFSFHYVGYLKRIIFYSGADIAARQLTLGVVYLYIYTC